MDEGDFHPPPVGILADDSSEGIHLELQLLTLRNTESSWNCFNVQINGLRTVGVYRSRPLESHAGLLCLDLGFFEAGYLRLVCDCKLSVGRFND